MYIHIKNDVSDDSLFGPLDTPENYDIETLNKAIVKSVKKSYPHADVSLEKSNSQTAVITESGDWRIEADVFDIIHDEWQKWLDAILSRQ